MHKVSDSTYYFRELNIVNLFYFWGIKTLIYILFQRIKYYNSASLNTSREIYLDKMKCKESGDKGN